MKKLVFVLLVLLGPAWVFAQSPLPVAEVQVDMEAARGQIQAQRSREEERFSQEEAACQARFAVTRCQHEVRVRQREVLDQLRRQEIALNDAQRQRKAQEQARQIQENSSPQRLKEEADRRLEAKKAWQERVNRAAEKAAAAKAGLDSAASHKPDRVPEPQPTAGELAKKQQQYQDKLKEAQAHRANREKENKEKSATPVQALPAPP
jgi:hypothetical protein